MAPRPVAHGSRQNNFCCVTTCRCNCGGLRCLRRTADALTAHTLCLSVLGFGGVVLAASGLPPRRLPATDQPPAFAVLAVTLVPTPRLVRAATAFAQADPRPRSSRTGTAAVLGITMTTAHGSAISQGTARGERTIVLLGAEQNRQADGRSPVYTPGKEADREGNGLRKARSRRRGSTRAEVSPFLPSWETISPWRKLGALVVASLLGVIGIPGLALALLLPNVHNVRLRPGDVVHTITGYMASLLWFTFYGSVIGALIVGGYAALWSRRSSATSVASEAVRQAGTAPPAQGDLGEWDSVGPQLVRAVPGDLSVASRHAVAALEPTRSATRDRYPGTTRRVSHRRARVLRARSGGFRGAACLELAIADSAAQSVTGCDLPRDSPVRTHDRSPRALSNTGKQTAVRQSIRPARKQTGKETA